MKRISYEEADSIAWIGFGYNNSKSMTVLDEETLRELDALAAELAGKRSLVGAVFFTHKERCFLAGADISLIASLDSEAAATEASESGQKVFNAIEDLKIPTVACVHGVCLGGGTEFALACDTILVSDDSSTQMGLPEVKLGILPGLGGTYRLPRKIGLPAALDLILTGKSVPAKKCLKLGLAREMYPMERLQEMAPKHLNEKKRKGLGKSLSALALDNLVSRRVIFQKARESVLKKTKGHYQAPLKILESMESAMMMRKRSGHLSVEAQGFGELCVGEQSKNLRHIYFMMEAAKKYQGEVLAKADSIKRGAVLGAGTMGGGIAWLMANHSMSPVMKDVREEALERGLAQASSNFRGALKRRRISQEDFERNMRSIAARLDYRGFGRADLVVEAVVEDMAIKKKLLAEVEDVVREQCLLTTNTSSLSVTEMAKALKHPGRFVGLHFFNPVHRMPLVEIISHEGVEPQALRKLYQWCLSAKKTPVVVKDGPGFLVNRILMPFLNEASFLLEEGVPLEKIERVCRNFGMPMGPFRLLDEVGLDVALKVSKVLHQGLGERAGSGSLTASMVEKGWLGKKSGRGFYIYDQGEKGENSALKVFLPTKRKNLDEATIEKRIFLPMVNEAAYILQEGLVENAQQVDLGLIFGIGFPPFRGGLLRYADSEGVDTIVADLDRLAQEVDGQRYQACPLLKETKTFY